jgi:hypothetical protein
MLPQARIALLYLLSQLRYAMLPPAYHSFYHTQMIVGCTHGIYHYCR